MKINKWFLKLLFLAVILRLLVSGLLFHPDVKTIAFQTSFLKKGVINIYPFLEKNKASLPLKEEFVYFPLTYFTIGGYQAVISSILGAQFNNWLVDAGSNSMVNNPHVIQYLIFLKLPLLVMDILIAFLLYGYFKKKEDGEKAFVFWLFNPFTIFLIYAFSNIDLYPALLTLIAFLYINKSQLFKASIFIGLAISFKLYPLLFVPFLFISGKTVKEKIIVTITPLLIFFASIVPFLSSSFVKSALLSGLSTRIFSPSFAIGFGESMILGLFLISVLFFWGWASENKITLFKYFVVLLLTVFSFSHFHISWLLWVAPFLTIFVVKKPKVAWLVFFWAVSAICIPLFYSDRSMTISLFRIYSTWYDLLPTPFTIMEKIYDPYIVQSMLHSLMAGISVVLSYLLLREEKEELN
jgi:hypothetical protein